VCVCVCVCVRERERERFSQILINKQGSDPGCWVIKAEYVDV